MFFFISNFFQSKFSEAKIGPHRFNRLIDTNRQILSFIYKSLINQLRFFITLP